MLAVDWSGRNGYGAIKHAKKVLSTHVVAFHIAGGTLDPGELVTHSCDCKLCCNPAHLKAGTPTSNVREMHDRIAVNTTQGAKHPTAVLTDDTVRLIHALKIARGASYRKQSRLLGINEGTIAGALYREHWTHVPVPTAEEAEKIVANWESSIAAA